MAPEHQFVETVADALAERGHSDRTDGQLLDRIERALETHRLATQRPPDVDRSVHCDQCGARPRSDSD